MLFEVEFLLMLDEQIEMYVQYIVRQGITMEILYLFLGALLALAGGVLTHHVQMHYSRIKEEENVLLDVEISLLEIGALGDRLGNLDKESVLLQTKLEINECKSEIAFHLQRLHLYAIRLVLNQNRDIAIKTTKYALDPHLRNEQNRYDLLRLVQKSINPELIKQYEDQMVKNPEKF